MREQIAEGSEFDPLDEIKGRSKEFISRVQEDPQVRSLASILLHKCEYIDEVNPIKLRHLSGRNECICDIEKLFESAIERGELATTVDARIAVIGLFSLVDGLIYNWLLAPDYFPLVEYGNQAIDSYINGLAR
jgi:TetR/AcrR family acrAB operon transcriptional repressor